MFCISYQLSIAEEPSSILCARHANSTLQYKLHWLLLRLARDIVLVLLFELKEQTRVKMKNDCVRNHFSQPRYLRDVHA